jgi:hypothetical protein
MPHKIALRQSRMESFEESTLATISRINRIRVSKLSTAKKLRQAAKLKKGLVMSLQEMKINKEGYGFGPFQLKVLDTLIEQTKKAKSEDDLLSVWRTTCLLKNDSK